MPEQPCYRAIEAIPVKALPPCRQATAWSSVGLLAALLGACSGDTSEGCASENLKASVLRTVSGSTATASDRLTITNLELSARGSECVVKDTPTVLVEGVSAGEFEIERPTAAASDVRITPESPALVSLSCTRATTGCSASAGDVTGLRLLLDEEHMVGVEQNAAWRTFVSAFHPCEGESNTVFLAAPARVRADSMTVLALPSC
jgi:hypothetical protein